MSAKDMLAQLVCWALVGAASLASADQSPLIASLQQNIALAEQTLRQEPYLTQFCGHLSDGKHFLHRGRYRAGQPPVISLASASLNSTKFWKKKSLTKCWYLATQTQH